MSTTIESLNLKIEVLKKLQKNLKTKKDILFHINSLTPEYNHGIYLLMHQSNYEVRDHISNELKNTIYLLIKTSIQKDVEELEKEIESYL
jgi:hypothetical protein